MRTCKRCGVEVSGRKMYCDACARNRRNASRKARDDALRSCGLIKVRGALGGTYWE